MIIRIGVTVILLIFSSIALPNVPLKRELLGGIYIDSFSGISIKGGQAILLRKKWNEYEPFIYSDVELGTKARKIAIGMGALIYISNYRIGLSYAHDGDDSLIGVEGSASHFIYSFKMGLYTLRSMKETYFGVGLGIGF